MPLFRLALSAVCLAAATSPAYANGVVAEANYARANGNWGTELGGGLDVGAGPISIRPIAGVFLRDGGTAFYAKGEATFTLPASAEIGAGARFSGDRVRAYGTASVPLLPWIRLKGNIGDRYYAIGLRAGF
jgi:hypothetical protein